jgi:hypothetical protein
VVCLPCGGRPESLVGGRCHPRHMDVTVTDIERVPWRNLRVPRAEFAGVWTAGEGLHGAQVADSRERHIFAGIVTVCRWLALVSSRAPVTGRKVMADPETIEAEVEALMADIDATPRPAWLSEPAGWADGVVATLDWAWQAADPPLNIGTAYR